MKSSFCQGISMVNTGMGNNLKNEWNGWVIKNNSRIILKERGWDITM